MLSETKKSNHCVFSNRCFLIMEIAALSILLVLGTIGVMQGDPNSRTIFLLVFVYLLFGSLAFLNRFTVHSCPSRVLAGGLIFISASVILNNLLF